MIDLKEQIINQIQATNDELLLKQIEVLLKEEISSIYSLTEEEKVAINVGLDDIKNGRTISNEDLQQEWNSWL
ncbi:MAG: hypothetical protein R2739_02775 [Chitinophagales bacterium]|nr:hypothetical protein [Bacteroidota bacterium]